MNAIGKSLRSRFALASQRVVLPDGVRPAVVTIEGSKIVKIDDLQPYTSAAPRPARLPNEPVGSRSSSDVPVEMLDDLVIAPGLVDTHVHVNEPGRTEWEGFATASMSAAAGGVTTLVDMPLNSSPVTTSVAALEAKRNAAAGKCWVDVGLYGGLIPGNSNSIGPLLEAGVLGIKAFLCHSGIDEFPNATLCDLEAAAPVLVDFNRPLLVHAELSTPSPSHAPSARRYQDYLVTRPPQWESNAIEMLVAFCRATRCPVHIVHLANGDAIGTLEAAKQDGLPMTVETCSHYLYFSPDDVPDGGTQFKCAPPIREARHRELLWGALKRGAIDSIGSDHSPCPPAMKNLASGDFMQAWGGIASLELTLPVVWSGAAQRGVGVQQVFEWLSTNPARLVRIADRKGQIAIGRDADLVIWNPDVRWTVRAQQLYQRHKLTPYDGQNLRGKVCRTYLRGNLIYQDGELVANPLGQLLAAAA